MNKKFGYVRVAASVPEIKVANVEFNVKEIINELSSKKITKYYYGSFPPTGTVCSDRYMLEYDGNRISLEASGYMWVNDDFHQQVLY